jgi:osmotically-inducible protein OsmY
MNTLLSQIDPRHTRPRRRRRIRATQLVGKRARTRVIRPAPLFLAAGVGALAGFFLDPQLGRRRRHVVRDRTAGIARRALRRSRRRAAYAESLAHGYVQRLRHGGRPDETTPDDATLTSRVESELFRPADIPKGQLNVNVQHGVVQLRGEVPRPEMIEALVDRARRIAGVRDVENLLHLPGSRAPMHR